MSNDNLLLHSSNSKLNSSDSLFEKASIILILLLLSFFETFDEVKLLKSTNKFSLESIFSIFGFSFEISLSSMKFFSLIFSILFIKLFKINFDSLNNLFEISPSKIICNKTGINLFLISFFEILLFKVFKLLLIKFIIS